MKNEKNYCIGEFEKKCFNCNNNVARLKQTEKKNIKIYMRLHGEKSTKNCKMYEYTPIEVLPKITEKVMKLIEKVEQDEKNKNK